MIIPEREIYAQATNPYGLQEWAATSMYLYCVVPEGRHHHIWSTGGISCGLTNPNSHFPELIHGSAPIGFFRIHYCFENNSKPKPNRFKISFMLHVRLILCSLVKGPLHRTLMPS